MTVRLERSTLRKLERLARATARSKAFLAQEAIVAYVELNEWQIHAIREGVRSADAGRVVEHDLVEAWLESWGRLREREPPECK
jgi:predicted transcriptional regulator